MGSLALAVNGFLVCGSLLFGGGACARFFRVLFCGARVGLGFLFILAFGQPVAVAIQSPANRQGKDFRRCPPGMDDVEAQIHPVVAPAKDLYLLLCVAGGITGDDQIGDLPMPHGQDPAGHQQLESGKTGLGKNRMKVEQQSTKRFGKIHRRPPCAVELEC